MPARIDTTAQPVTVNQIYRLVKAFYEIEDRDIREAVIRFLETTPSRLERRAKPESPV